MVRTRTRFCIVALILLAACAVGAGTSGAGSLLAVSGTWTMTSDPGDWVGQGQSYAFSQPDDRIESGSGLNRNGVGFSAYAGGTYWSGIIGAPTGQQLVPGTTYANATRFGDATHPRLDVSGDGRGCNATTGQFTIIDINFGPYGYLNSVHLTFEQHCEGLAPALRGDINLVEPAGPPTLQVHLTVDPTVGFDRSGGALQLHGTITCSQPVQAGVSGQVSQQTKKGQAFAYLNFYTYTCSDTPTPWKIKVTSATDNPFTNGTVQVDLTGSAIDSYYSTYNQYDPWIYATDAFTGPLAAKAGG